MVYLKQTRKAVAPEASSTLTWWWFIDEEGLVDSQTAQRVFFIRKGKN